VNTLTAMRTAFTVGAAVVALLMLPGLGVQPRAHETVNTSVTFDREISRILTRKCLPCHAPGRLAFPLTSYEETRPWARAIEAEVLARRMPPWRGVPGYGRFANDGGLSGRELQLLVAWVEGNGPKDAAQRLVANVDQFRTPRERRLKADLDRWRHGRPAIVRQIGGGRPASDQADPVGAVDIDLRLVNDTLVRGIEFIPADRRTLRGASFYVRETGQWLGSWTPWHGASLLPAGTVHRVPRGAHVIARLHGSGVGAGAVAGAAVRAAGSAAVAGTVGLHTGRGTRCTSDIVVGGVPTAATVRATAAVTADTAVLALLPELPPEAASIEVTASRPDGTRTTLLFAKDLLPAWPTPYILETPVALPAGSVLTMVVHAREGTGGGRSAVRMMVASTDPSGCAGPSSGGRAR